MMGFVNFTTYVTLVTLLTLPKRLTLLALTICMNRLFYYDCLGH